MELKETERERKKRERVGGWVITWALVSWTGKVLNATYTLFLIFQDRR